MSKTLLDALKKHNLQAYYPTFHVQGISYSDIIQQVGADDYSNLGLRSHEDKSKFQALYRDLYSVKANTTTTRKSPIGIETNARKSPIRTEINGQANLNTRKPNMTPIHSNNSNNTIRKEPITPNRNNNNNNNNNNHNLIPLKKETFSPIRAEVTIPVRSDKPIKTDNNSNLIPSRKRPLPLGRISPERRARRMTIAPTTQRTQPSKVSSAVRDRRLSYLPRDRPLMHRSPTRPTATSKTTTTTLNTSPNRLIKRPKILDESNSFEAPKPSIMERPSTRLLDAYGVPITNTRQNTQKSNELPRTLEEFLSAKAKAKANSSSNTTTNNAVTNNTGVYNELHQRIRVCVRKRPLSKKELLMQETDIVPMVGSRTIQLNAPKFRINLDRYTEKHTFTFDDTFDGNSTNEEIYARTAQPLVEYVFTGGKATCFAHGQTGSGKTYTMLDPNHGLYVLAAHDIFRLLSKPKYSHLTASVGFYEIYQGQLYDLLNLKEKLTARDDGNNNVVIAGLREHPISDVKELMTIFEYGNQGRTTGQTGANETSSRSHAVLQVLLKKKDNPTKVYGKLSFIDLAGSERGADRGDADTKTRLEGAEINKSLLALKECIRALDQDQKHTPFRGSKLTQVLRDSFIGNSRTCMIATISPNNSNSEHTLNTLRYADRVKQLRGESDPRISGSNQTKLSIFDEDDIETTSITSWEDNENLLDVDCPTSVTTNLLATPTNNRFLPVSEDRQKSYLLRLESPPAEVFSSHTIIEDPFGSKPLYSSQHSDNNSMDSTMSKLEISSSQQKKDEIDTRQVRNFVEFHRNQLSHFNECLRDEQRMIAKLALTMPDSNHDDEEYQQSKEEYETYLNDLEDVLDRKTTLIEHMREKLKEQYVEE